MLSLPLPARAAGIALSCAVFALSGSAALAQTTTPEIEPNETKALATTNGIITMISGDKLTGTTTGTATTAGPTSLDTFHIKTGPLPFGIYRHTLTITTAGTVGHTGTIRGLSQTAGAPNAGTDVAHQTSSTTSSPARTNVWFGFGKSEQIYYRVTGGTATTTAYEVTLTTTPVLPGVIATGFTAGLVTVQTVGQTTTDTELFVYDVNLDPVPGAHNDDEGPVGPSLQSRMARTLPSGEHYVVVSDYNTANNLGDANADEDHLTGTLLDFPNALCSSDFETTPYSYNFQVSDGVNIVNQAATGDSLAGISFWKFTVGTPAPAPIPYCFGDGTGTPCPCSPTQIAHGQTGRGCPNNLFPAGARLVASGTPSLANDTLVLSASQVINASIAFIQGTARQSSGMGSVFGDGLRCAGGSLRVLGTKLAAANASSFGGTGPKVSVTGLVTAPGMRTYQGWYRSANPTWCLAGQTFNLTNGVEISWVP